MPKLIICESTQFIYEECLNTQSSNGVEIQNLLNLNVTFIQRSLKVVFSDRRYHWRTNQEVIWNEHTRRL